LALTAGVAVATTCATNPSNPSKCLKAECSEDICYDAEGNAEQVKLTCKPHSTPHLPNWVDCWCDCPDGYHK
jgi:hypothetical protein